MGPPAETELANQENPYLGPRPFARTDAHRFFGRDREVAELCSLVSAHRTVLLYSQSGAGKSSLLHAGVIPQLEARGFDILPTARVSGATEEGLPPGIDNIYVLNCKRFWDDNAPSEATLAGILASRARRVASGAALPRIIVFDQFEELFTAYPGRWQQRAGFFSDLNDAMIADPTLRALFAMREDFVAHLDAYEDQLPEELRTRYRLEQLREEAALAAVEKPLDLTGIRFKPGVAALLVADLLSVPSGEAGTARVPGEFVDPVQMQVTCFSFFRNLPPTTTEITERDLKAFGNVDQALRDFYGDALRETAANTGAEEDSLRQWFENKLLTEAGTRGLVFRGDETTGGIANAAVDLLEKTHIIRADVRGRDRWYELSHDRFIQPILRANDEWRGRVKEKALEEARLRADEEAAKRERELARQRELEQARLLATEQKIRADLAARSAKRWRRGVVALIAALFVAVAAMIFAFLQRRSTLAAIAKTELANDKATSAIRSAAEQSKKAEFYKVAAGVTELNGERDGTVKLQVTAPVGQSPAPKHLIVLMMESRSFDHMLGALKAADSRIDGLTGDESNPDMAGNQVTVQPLAAFQGQLNPDPDQNFTGVDLQIFGGDTGAGRTANMHGFVKSYFSRQTYAAHTRSASLNQQADSQRSRNVMYYFASSKLPVLATLAKEFAVCDRWFSSVPGPPIPNRAFAHYGTSFGHVDNSLLLSPTRYRSIYERLGEGGRNAKVYFYDVQSSSMDMVNLVRGRPEFFGTFAQFLSDAAGGKLPDYSFVEPNYTDHDSDSGSQLASDEHPDHNVQAGELFIAQVYQAIKTNPTLWRESILLITYSSHGGIYDHVPPPEATPDGFVAPSDQTGTGSSFAFDRFGVRVPAVIVSPYISRGTVDHTVYDHASIPATVSKLFLSGPQNISPRERTAHTFDHVLTLKAPRANAPDFNIN